MMDASLAGMGGCPFVPGEKGNVVTQDLIRMLEDMGIETGYDLKLLNKIEYTNRNSSAEYILINEDGEEVTVLFSMEKGQPVVETGVAGED